mgnify:CR=1 FL=1
MQNILKVEISDRQLIGAVRNGLKQAESVLLEPYYEFTLEVPTENVGRGDE